MDDEDRKPTPEIGEFLSSSMVEELYEAFKAHQANFPNAPEIVSFHLILMNYGNKFTPVKCIEEEWFGTIQDVPTTFVDQPKCPNGHALEKGEPLRLAWMM